MGVQLLGEGLREGRIAPTPPAEHRAAVSETESNPANTTTSIKVLGFSKCRFDFDIITGSLTSSTWQALHWNALRSKFFAGSAHDIAAMPATWEVDTWGTDYLYAKCSAIVGGGTVRIDYSLY